MASLSNTPWKFFYSVVFVKEDDLAFMNRLNSLFIALIFVTFWLNWYSWLDYGKLLTKNSKIIKEEKLSFLAFANYTVSSKTTWLVCFFLNWTMPLILIFTTPCIKLWNVVNFVGLCAFVIHYFYRCIVYSSLIFNQAKWMELKMFIVLAVCAALLGIYEGHYLINVHSSCTTIINYLGLVICIVGNQINTYHDRLLINLRKDIPEFELKQKKVYKIPRGGLFEYVSCANYLGEILEWWGLAIFTTGLPQVLLATFTTVFLGYRAIETHRFYKATFQDQYPSKRKILLPFML